MGSKFRDYDKQRETEAQPAERMLLDAFADHFEEEHQRTFGLPGMIALARKRAGMSQQQLAAQSGVDQAEISRIESGLGNPTFATIERLAGPLHVQVALVDDDGIPLKR